MLRQTESSETKAGSNRKGLKQKKKRREAVSIKHIFTALYSLSHPAAPRIQTSSKISKVSTNKDWPTDRINQAYGVLIFLFLILRPRLLAGRLPWLAFLTL